MIDSVNQSVSCETTTVVERRIVRLFVVSVTELSAKCFQVAVVTYHTLKTVQTSVLSRILNLGVSVESRGGQHLLDEMK